MHDATARRAASIADRSWVAPTRGLSLAGVGLLSSGAAVMGALVLFGGEIPPEWSPLPKGDFDPQLLADAVGALLLVCAAGLWIGRFSRWAALALALLLAAKILLVDLPTLLAKPGLELAWYGVAETLCWAAGPVAIFSEASGAPRGVGRLARYAFALSLLPIGLSHFFYLKTTVSLIPHWFILRPQLGIATGAAHMAAGLAVLLGVVSRFAASLEGVMMSLFTLIVWIPAVIRTPGDTSSWSEFALSLSLSGAAFAVAALLVPKARV